MLVLYILIFIFSVFLLFWSGKLLVSSLMKIAAFLQWREFVVAFLVVAVAGSLPNLLLCFMSIFHGIPELSLGDIIGGNVIDLTLVIALAVFVSGGIHIHSKMVQKSSLFTMVIALLPLLLVLDGKLNRGDGIILLFVFLFYTLWLFSKKERFSKVYESRGIAPVREFKSFFKSLIKVLFVLAVLLIAVEGMVRSSVFFGQSLNLPIVLVGIIIVGLGNSLPEMIFCLNSAKKGETWFILGNLMGAVIVPSTLVLGIMGLVHPFEIQNISFLTVGRIFLIISPILFYLFTKTGEKITKKEAFILLLIYITFVLTEIFHTRF